MKNIKELEQTLNIEGLKARPVNVSEDIPALLNLFNTANEVDEIAERDTLENLTAHYQHLRNCNPETDSIFLEVEGELICTGRTWWGEESSGLFAYSTTACVHPEWRKKGIGTEVQKWLETRAVEISMEHDPEAPKVYNFYAQETQKGKFRLGKEFGYKEERFFFEMTRDLSEPISEPELPENIEVRPVKKEDFIKIWNAKEEAFRDHWGFIEEIEGDYERWINRINTIPDYDISLWKVAWEGEEVAGMVLNMIPYEENKILNIKKGWTDPICVRHAWRKNGLATALINESLMMLKEMGMEHGALGVDTDNLSGALNMYKNCGFKTKNTFVILRKPLT